MRLSVTASSELMIGLAVARPQAFTSIGADPVAMTACVELVRLGRAVFAFERDRVLVDERCLAVGERDAVRLEELS